MSKKFVRSSLKKLAFLMMIALMVCSLAAPAFAGSNPVNYVASYLCTVNGSSATEDGSAIDNRTDVAYGSKTIEVMIDKNVTSDAIYNGETVYAHNQGCFTLTDVTDSANVSISVYRIGDGTTADPERQHLFFNASLQSGHSYEITIDPSLIANNGLTMGYTQYVDFTCQ